MDERGALTVSRAVITRGRESADDFDPLESVEQMVPHSKNERVKGNQSAWKPLRVRPDRALWRDSHAILVSMSSVGNCVGVLRFLVDIAREDSAIRGFMAGLHVLGCWYPPRRPASIVLVRHERQPLPMRYLCDDDLGRYLTRCLKLAEEVAQHMNRLRRRLAQEIASPEEYTKADEDTVERLRKAFPTLDFYWSSLDTLFRRLVVDLADEAVDRDAVESKWTERLRRLAWKAFDLIGDGLKQDARSLRAICLVRGEHQRRLSGGPRHLNPQSHYGDGLLHSG